MCNLKVRPRSIQSEHGKVPYENFDFRWHSWCSETMPQKYVLNFSLIPLYMESYLKILKNYAEVISRSLRSGRYLLRYLSFNTISNWKHDPTFRISTLFCPHWRNRIMCQKMIETSNSESKGLVQDSLFEKYSNDVCWMGFPEVKDAEANAQHKSIIGALKAAAPEWEFQQIKFVVGNRGSVVESNFYTKLKKLDIHCDKKEKKTSSSSIMWQGYAKRTIGWLCPSSSRCKEVRGQLQRDRGRTLGTVCTCEEIERGTHACRASQLGPVERWWTQDGKLGITIQNPPPESGRRTHLLYLLIHIAFCHVSENLQLHCLFYVTMNIYFCFLS